MPKIGIIEVLVDVQFEILVAYVTSTTEHLPEHMVLCESSNSTFSIIERGQVDKEHHHTGAMMHATSKPPVQEKKRTNAPTASKLWRYTINTSPECAVYCTIFINMLEHFR